MVDLMKPVPKPVFGNEDGNIKNYVISRLKSLGLNVISVEAPLVLIETAGNQVSLEMVSRETNNLNYAIQTIFDLNPTVVFIRDVVEYNETTGNFIIRFQYIRINHELIG
ncbi:hypothetical protein fHeYen901_233 [Yersinia phage fHe-Yen9-01]|uniref:Uncharacterized protein n=1 Tax=Yersinia phage fHe-Yen9-01 TaxID=1965363 RepID=A0A1V0DXW8_9CAUD|nr:hypothetical protein KNT60_gp232 [Yersinia phage fHe-Yen9-01]ARB06006.1 hypothetical protein fHeYen901_233 [Yersinia phage fHe-Yen9-01]